MLNGWTRLRRFGLGSVYAELVDVSQSQSIREVDRSQSIREVCRSTLLASLFIRFSSEMRLFIP